MNVFCFAEEEQKLKYAEEKLLLDNRHKDEKTLIIKEHKKEVEKIIRRFANQAAQQEELRRCKEESEVSDNRRQK